MQNSVYAIEYSHVLARRRDALKFRKPELPVIVTFDDTP